MSTDIELVSHAIKEFDRVAAGLEVLRKTYSGVLFDVETTEGLEHAKAARLVIRKPRYEVEKIRKDAKAPLLAIGKKLDSEAARITAELMALEDPIDQQIKSEEGRKEREKQAKIEAEAARINAIRTRIDAIRSAVTESFRTVERIDIRIVETDALVIDESFAEFSAEARDAKDATLRRLDELKTAAVARKAEDERIAQEREELARLRADAEARAAAERAKQAEEVAAARKELAKQEAEQRAAREAAETKLRQEREAFEREQAEIRERQAAEEAKRREEARVAAIKKPADAEIIRVLAEHYRVPVAKVRQWLAQMKVKEAA